MAHVLLLSTGECEAAPWVRTGYSLWRRQVSAWATSLGISFAESKRRPSARNSFSHLNGHGNRYQRRSQAETFGAGRRIEHGAARAHIPEASPSICTTSRFQNAIERPQGPSWPPSW